MDEQNGGTHGETETQSTQETSAANEGGKVSETSQALIADLKALEARMSTEGRDQLFWRDELSAIITAHASA